MRDDFPKGRALVLSGPAGVGKTHSAAAALLSTLDGASHYVRETDYRSGRQFFSIDTCEGSGGRFYVNGNLIEATHSRRFWTVSRLRIAMMDLDVRTEVLNAIVSVRFLVLNDIGIEYFKEGDFFDSNLACFIHERAHPGSQRVPNGS